MITNAFKLTGRVAAIALAAGTLPAHAQQYDIATIQTYDLGKQAGFADTISNVATLVAKPDGGAYIQWAASTNFNNRNRCTANSTVRVTTIDNLGQIQGDDIELGTSLPYGIAASPTGFGYLFRKMA